MPKEKQKCDSLNPKWIRQTRDYFLEFLKVTEFPHPARNGNRGSEFDYPEWIVMFIAILSVKCKVKTYVGMHKLSTQYWDEIVRETTVNKKPISERQLRDRLKKIRHFPRKPAVFISQIFPQNYLRQIRQRR